MTGSGSPGDDAGPLLQTVAAYADAFRRIGKPSNQSAEADELRALFDEPLPDAGRPAEEVIGSLIRAVEPGLTPSAHEGFMAWVIGSSHPVGVAADWLTSVWGQNAGIYQTAPAAAVAEEVCGRWLLELLDLPRTSSVGFVSGATMATFVGLSAARGEVLRRMGHDLEKSGLRNSPRISVLIGSDAHVANWAALRYLGIGTDDVIEVEATDAGVMDIAELKARAASVGAPAIVIAQAGHVNTGAFDRFREISEIARSLNAWLHVDGAFGLWARVSTELRHLTAGVELADSWAVDGHKWLQIPYDSGFAIVRDRRAHEDAMKKTAGYLNHSARDGLSPCLYTPELSRRARGFAVWAMLQTLGRNGMVELVETHCAAARRVAERCGRIEGIRVLNDVVLNQIALDLGPATQPVCDRINENGNFYLKTAAWRGRTIMRISMIGSGCDERAADRLAAEIEDAMSELRMVDTPGLEPGTR